MSYKEQVAGLLAKANKYRRLARTVSDQEIVGRISDLSDDLKKQAQKLNRMLREETIRSRAHQIWQEHNCPAGRDEEFWLQAERELDGGSSQRRSLC
jgi:ferric iron reductase protein FhuF